MFGVSRIIVCGSVCGKSFREYAFALIRTLLGVICVVTKLVGHRQK